MYERIMVFERASARRWIISQEQKVATVPLLFHLGICEREKRVAHVSGGISTRALISASPIIRNINGEKNAKGNQHN